MPQKPRIRFSVIGINHDHIHGQIGATQRGGGEFVAFYAKEPELAAAFAKRYPNIKQARSEAEILEDNTIQLVVSAGVPVERAPLGVAVMQHGKDYMSDKPGITTLAQLAKRGLCSAPSPIPSAASSGGSRYGGPASRPLCRKLRSLCS